MARPLAKLNHVRSQMAWMALASLLVGLVGGCGSPVTPEQMEAMSRLQAVGGRINVKRGGYEVDLKETVVSDQDLVHLQKIANLKNVDLTRTQITDIGLEHLKPLKSVEYIFLAGAKVTPEAVEDLRKALPNTEVRF